MGAEVGGGGIHDREGRPNSGERGLSVAAASLQMSDEPKKLPTNRGDSSGVWGECGRVPCGVGNLVLTIGTLARVVVENDFAHAHGFGRHFHVFVFANVFQRFFE